MTVDPETKKITLDSFSTKQKILSSVIIGIFIIISTIGYLFYKRSASSELQDTIQAVARHIELPSGEIPSLAIVKDKHKLPQQVFFDKAENNDRVLIYMKSGKVILYRPSTGKIVDIAALNINNHVQKPVEAATATNSAILAAVSIYNGTEIAGKGKQVKEQLTEKNISANFIEVANAQKKAYTKTAIFLLNPVYKTTAETIAKELKGDVILQLPEGEKKPSADILIIVGASVVSE